MNADMVVDPSNAATGVVDATRLNAALEFEDLSPISNPSWQMDPGTFTRTTIVDDQGSTPAFPFDVTINGNTTRPVGTKWMLFDMSTIAGDGSLESMLLKFHGYADEHFYNAIRAGFLKVEVGAPPGQNINFDISQIYGPFSIPQLGMRPTGDHIWYAHTDAGTGFPTIPVTDGVFFYQWFRDMVNDIYQIRFYDPSDNYALIGESELELDGSTLWSYADYWLNGYNGSQPPANVKIWFGPTVYKYDPTGFEPFDTGNSIEFSGTLTVGTLSVG
jgi:hypothetical protein